MIVLDSQQILKNGPDPNSLKTKLTINTAIQVRTLYSTFKVNRIIVLAWLPFFLFLIEVNSGTQQYGSFCSLFPFVYTGHLSPAISDI